MKPLPQFTVRDLMQKNICFVKETVALSEAVKVMAEKKISSLIVEKEHAQDAYGILTRKDVVVELAENWESLASLKVADLSTKPIVSIPADVGVKHAARLMRLTGVRRLAVFDGDKIIGIISNGDLFKAILENQSAK